MFIKLDIGDGGNKGDNVGDKIDDIKLDGKPLVIGVVAHGASGVTASSVVVGTVPLTRCKCCVQSSSRLS